jgi:hypothetical protein
MSVIAREVGPMGTRTVTLLPRTGESVPDAARGVQTRQACAGTRRRVS